MSGVIKCAVPHGTLPSEFAPFPGGDEATRLGCTCPHQPLWPQEIRLASDCPVHELERVPN